MTPDPATMPGPAHLAAPLRRALDYLALDGACPATARLLADQIDRASPQLESLGADTRDLLELATALEDPACDAENATERLTALLARPELAPPHLFHGTAAARLPEIARRGLIPGQPGAETARDAARARHCRDKLFLTGSEVQAAAYALTACPDARPRHLADPLAAVLRVPRTAVPDLTEDPEGLSGLDLYTTAPIPAACLAVAWPPLTARAWRPLSAVGRPT